VCGRARRDTDPRDAAYAWTMDRADDRTWWTCPECSLRHVRSIEAKLKTDWW
jgi:hypothetical protein